MPNLNRGSKTYRNLKDAFGIESEASCRHLYSRARRTSRATPTSGGFLPDTAEAEMEHAHGHLDYVKAVDNPAPESPIGSTSKNLGVAVAQDTYAYTKMYPGMARVARDEGFTDIAEWFETLAKAEKSHARDASRRRSTSSPSCERAIEGGRRSVRSPSG